MRHHPKDLMINESVLPTGSPMKKKQTKSQENQQINQATNKQYDTPPQKKKRSSIRNFPISNIE